MGIKRVYSHATKLRVRYADTDKMQVVNNGKYFEYLEVGRTELLRSMGLTYSELERNGVQLPLVEAWCKFKIPARYDDLLVVSSQVSLTPSPRLTIDYTITLEANPAMVIATGKTIHAFQRVDTGKIIRPPELFMRLLKMMESQLE